MALLKTDAASKSLFCAYSENAESADNLWFLVTGLHDFLQPIEEI